MNPQQRPWLRDASMRDAALRCDAMEEIAFTRDSRRMLNCPGTNGALTMAMARTHWRDGASAR